MGKAVCRLLEGKYEIRCFLDRNAKLWNTRIHHRYLVKNPEDADIDRSCKVVVAMVSDTFYHIKNSLKATGGGYQEIVPAGELVRELYKKEEQYFTNIWKLDSEIRVDDYLEIFQDEQSMSEWKMAYEWFKFGTETSYHVQDRNRFFPDFLKEEVDRCMAMLDTAALNREYIDTFLKANQSRKVYALQLHPASIGNHVLMRKYASAENVKLFDYEAGECNTVLCEKRLGLMEPFTDLQTVNHQTKKIDDMELPYFDYLRCYSMSRADAILKGAAVCIQKYRPLIAVNIGHYESDFVQVPFTLKRLCENYSFYFRVHNYQGNDCLMYAVPQREFTSGKKIKEGYF